MNKKITDEAEKEKNYQAINDLRRKNQAAKAELTAKQEMLKEMYDRHAKERADEQAQDEKAEKVRKQKEAETQAYNAAKAGRDKW